MMETTSNRRRFRHLLIDSSFWGSYLLAGMLLGAAMLLSSCAIYPAYPAAPVYYGPPYYGPYYYHPYHYYYPHYYGGYGCRWRC
jgi:hypothetical protein